mmetsp:Transcript_120367/g.300267  ORF Transcript_120367/g.300267 Transcript_120367/m.300267 type:complete len:548 (+) Transcript_120367:64-1707(+)
MAATSPLPTAENLTSCIRQPRRRNTRQATVTLDPSVVHIDEDGTSRASSGSSTSRQPAATRDTAPLPQDNGHSSSWGWLGRRHRRCTTLPARPPPQSAHPAEEAADPPQEAQLRPRRRDSRCSTAPAEVLRQPLQWADPNACKALTELVLDDRRRAMAGIGGGMPSAPALCAQLIAPFLRFDEPLQNMLYVFGGRNKSSLALDTVEMFDSWHGQWVTQPPLPTPRVSATAAALPDGRILVIGGYDRRGMIEGLLATCEVYDPRTRTWQAGGATSMQRARWGHGCAALGGNVYVIGGCSLARHARPAVTSMETLKSCEVYCPKEDAWTEIAPLQTSRSGSRLVAVAGRYLAAIGGCDDIFGREQHLKTVELYDPKIDVWTLLEQRLDHPRPIAGAAVMGDSESSRVLVMGGAAALSAAEVYEVEAPRTEGGAEAQQANATSPPSVHRIADAPAGRMGCQAAAFPLPAQGKSFPAATRQSVVVVGGEVWEPNPPGVTRPPKRSEFSNILVFDVASGTWRSDEVMPPMPTARTVVALCVGEGHAWRPQNQ